ncbi:hypothetical protein NH340_JMT07242 [Sarcoptes scabiei]|nr:hypothetical protein NH340_JMT07242 [Sarcoptes scabiei]
MKRYERIEAHLGGNLLAVFEGTKNAKKDGKIEESAKEKLYGFEMSWNFGLVRYWFNSLEYEKILTQSCCSSLSKLLS